MITTSKHNVTIFGNHDLATIEQIERCATEGSLAVLCADGHRGYSQPIGGVVAYHKQVSISGVGYDIACGNMAIETNLRGDVAQSSIQEIMRDIQSSIAFGVGRTNGTKLDEHPVFNNDEVWGPWDKQPARDLRRKAMDQLGTVGSGNHYVDIFVDDSTNRVWVGVHFGSRGSGWNIANFFLKAAGYKEGNMDVPPCIVPEESQIGQDYLQAMHLAGLYAYAGREHVARYVVKCILGSDILQEVHNHHNFMWRESHFGKVWNVVRKGSTPCFPGQRSFIGGSMGDDAVIVEGVDSEMSRQALYSTVHGAGRVMSRAAAKGKFVKVQVSPMKVDNLHDADGTIEVTIPKYKKVRQPGLVRHDDMMKWIRDKGVCLVGGDLDEAPQAYRRLDEVLAHHKGTFKIRHTLRPIGVAMAGEDIKDPYKD
jgi:tRNA-splicing ligase RtcB (3'-phosphate/5'-hydroxy nucleic acid ligase)